VKRWQDPRGVGAGRSIFGSLGCETGSQRSRLRGAVAGAGLEDFASVEISPRWTQSTWEESFRKLSGVAVGGKTSEGMKAMRGRDLGLPGDRLLERI